MGFCAYFQAVLALHIAISVIIEPYVHASPAIVPFKVNVPSSALNDLKSRLKNSRVVSKQLEGINDFTYGINEPTLVAFKNYWLKQYSWRKAEKQLNSLPQFMTKVQGLKIHFIHAKPPPGKYSRVVPIMLIHGWPGSVYDFNKMIPMLTDPQKNLPAGNGSSDFAFEVIAPSLPGFGWSEKPKSAGMDQIQTAILFNSLMVDRLGFSKYMAQGGDWGSVVAGNMARLFPQNFLGLHVNHICHLPYSGQPSNQGGVFVAVSATEPLEETGYLLEHATKPDTIGVGLNDSPIGLMGYLLEKYSTATNPAYIHLPDGGLTLKYTEDELLTSISIDWFNGNAVSEARYYKAFFENETNAMLPATYLSVPTGYGAPSHDLFHCAAVPESVANVYYNVCQYNQLPGGHYAAFETPVELARDVFSFSEKALNNQCSGQSTSAPSSTNSQ